MKDSVAFKIVGFLLKTAVCVVCIGLTVKILASFVLVSDNSRAGALANATDYAITDRYNMFMTNTLSDALDGVLSIKKVYWLNDDDLVAPEPNQDCYGSTDDPSTLQWLLDDAAELLDGQQTLFSTDVELFQGSEVLYYLDETILAITWKEVMDDAVYTISEIKIAHPSQFRRFLADGEYASGSKYKPSEMAPLVNAVVAANGDFYTFRNTGIIVYDSRLMRMEGNRLDTCFIDRNGDLLFAHRGQMTDQQEVEKFVEDNGIRFSLAFGPVLIEDGQKVPIKDPYSVGEGNLHYCRMALCQRDTLHYLLVTVADEDPFEYPHNLSVFQDNVYDLGCDKAYNLDGGQSATLIMNDKTVNYVWERLVSDIIYFATAIPDGE